MNKILLSLVVVIFLLSVFFLNSVPGLRADSGTITTTVKISVCGNGVREGGEGCDGVDFAGTSCVSLGFASGTVACSISCDVVTDACVAPLTPPSTSSGRGGGGGGSSIYRNTASVALSGKAYPGSKITVLKDAEVAVVTVADSSANWSVEESGLGTGSYIFSVQGEDIRGNKSSLINFAVQTSASSKVTINDIYIAPTIGVDKIEVKKGDIITLYGQSIADANLTVVVNSEHPRFFNIRSDKDGVYLHRLSTVPLEYGDHSAKTRLEDTAGVSSYSRAVSFRVGTENISISPPAAERAGDLNYDDRINLTDFSILAYWYKRASPPVFVDMLRDGTVDLRDFSILASNWTG